LNLFNQTTLVEKQIKEQFFKQGFHNLFYAVPISWIHAIELRDWRSLDQLAGSALKKNGEIYKLIEPFCSINKTQHLISLRSAPDEAGIWHDDGSRELAFSLSLNFKKFEGKGLGLRKKNQRDTTIYISFRELGTLTLFLTGAEGHEHRTEEVIKGERLILAGWIN